MSFGGFWEISHHMKFVQTKGIHPLWGHYTIIVPMPRISACIPWHRHGYLTLTRGRYPCLCHGIQADIRGIRHNSYIRGMRAQGYRQISVAYATG